MKAVFAFKVEAGQITVAWSASGLYPATKVFLARAADSLTESMRRT